MSVLMFHEIDGTLIPSEGGRLLSSPSYAREAAEWTEKHKIAGDLAVIVGLGAGHHVRTWLAAHPGSRVIVVESRPALVNLFRTANTDLRDRVELVIVESVEGLLKHEIMETAAATLAPVLLFAPCAGEQEKLFNEFFATLSGRNPAGLNFYLRSFGFEGDAVLENVGEGRLLTIKDLGLVIDTAHEGHPQASAVRVLRELLL